MGISKNDPPVSINIPGTLNVTVQKATLLKDVDLFTKMDPYVVLEYSGKERVRTKTHENGGKTPSWNETLKIPISSLDDVKGQLKITLMEEDKVRHEEVGSEALAFSLLYGNSQGFAGDVYIYRKDRNS